MSAFQFNRDTYGYGYEGFRCAIRVICRDLGGYDKGVREGVSKDFSRALSTTIRNRAKNWSIYDWCNATDEDFDYAVLVQVEYATRAPKGDLIAVADYRAGENGALAWGGSRLELYEDTVYLAGTSFRLPIAMISHHPGVYDTRTRSNIEKWGPFLTDLGEAAAPPQGTSPRSVQTLSPAAAHTALRKLVERHYHVTFTNVDPSVKKAA